MQELLAYFRIPAWDTRLRIRRKAWPVVVVLLAICLRCSEQAEPQGGKISIRGRVVNTEGVPIAGAAVDLSDQGPAKETASDEQGRFVFSGLALGTYVLTAEKAGLRTRPLSLVALKLEDLQPVELVLEKAPGAAAATKSMEFADSPTFEVAGVSDWTAAGGHGSDAILRTSEALARDARNLKPNGSASGEAKSAESELSAKLRLQGDSDERLGNPLAAVRDYEEAVRLDPSEQNYFAWGSELLFHRAVWQARDVFEQGVKAYPKSSRLLTALGSALFAGALYDEAARRLCQASDLNPADREPYIFMGKVEIASPKALECVEPRLARFAQRQPNESVASYFYAMAIWKQSAQPLDQETERRIRELLSRAVAIDSRCSDAYLQLGNLDSTRHSYSTAIDSYKKAIDSNPQLSEAHYRLAMAYDRVGDQANAKREFEKHDEIEKQLAAEVDRQRREVKQFVVITPGTPDSPRVQ